MTKAKAAEPAAAALQQPAHGGSFLRQTDGTLVLVEGAIDPTDAPAGDAETLSKED